MGDYNVALDPKLDTKNYLNENNPQARRALTDKMEEFNLGDVWRELNPHERKYTWKNFRQTKNARLDLPPCYLIYKIQPLTQVHSVIIHLLFWTLISQGFPEEEVSGNSTLVCCRIKTMLQCSRMLLTLI